MYVAGCYYWRALLLLLACAVANNHVRCSSQHGAAADRRTHPTNTVRWYTTRAT